MAPDRARAGIRVDLPSLWSLLEEDQAYTQALQASSQHIRSPPGPELDPTATPFTLLQALLATLPHDASLLQTLMAHMKGYDQSQLVSALHEVLWRVRALHAQVKPQGAILFVPFFPDVPDAAGVCLLCGDPLSASCRWRCEQCVVAAKLVLGFISLEEWVQQLFCKASC